MLILQFSIPSTFEELKTPKPQNPKTPKPRFSEIILDKIVMAEKDAEEVQKVLLMGRAGSGKTSMRSIIFANYLARETYRFTFTVDINRSRLRFLGNLVLSLWD